MNVRITPCAFADIEHLSAAARKDGLIFNERTEMFAVRIEGRTVGFCGILWHKTYAIFKNDYVLPEFRGIGLGDSMLRYRIALVRASGLRRIKAHCTPASLSMYQRHGATITHQYKQNAAVTISLP